MADLPDEDTYPPLPQWVPHPAMLLIFHDGRTQFGIDGGTDLPNDRRLRHSGIGIFAGGTSSWQYHSVLRSSIQMKDKTETVAAVLLAEAVAQQIDIFPSGPLPKVFPFAPHSLTGPGGEDLGRWLHDCARSLKSFGSPGPLVTGRRSTFCVVLPFRFWFLRVRNRRKYRQ